MRIILTIALLTFIGTSAEAKEGDVIYPVDLELVTAILTCHGYGVGPDYGGAIIAGDKAADLEFSRIDPETTLIISYRKQDKKVVSLDVDFFPPTPMPKLGSCVVRRKVRKVLFDDDDTFTVALQRIARRQTEPDGNSAEANPFE